MCLGSLSWWKIQTCFINSLIDGRWHFRKNLIVHGPIHPFLITDMSFLSHFKEKQPQSMFPPTCFSLSMVFMELYSHSSSSNASGVYSKEFHTTFSKMASGKDRLWQHGVLLTGFTNPGCFLRLFRSKKRWSAWNTSPKNNKINNSKGKHSNKKNRTVSFIQRKFPTQKIAPMWSQRAEPKGERGGSTAVCSETKSERNIMIMSPHLESSMYLWIMFWHCGKSYTCSKHWLYMATGPRDSDVIHRNRFTSGSNQIKLIQSPFFCNTEFSNLEQNDVCKQ